MNGWDVGNSVVTLSVSSFVAFKVAKMTLLASQRDEKARRKQDAIVALGDLFARGHADVERELTLSMTTKRVSELEDPTFRSEVEQALGSIMLQSIDRWDEMNIGFQTIIFRLQILHLGEPLARLQEYLTCFNQAHDDDRKGRLDHLTIKNEIASKLKVKASAFQKALADVCPS